MSIGRVGDDHAVVGHVRGEARTIVITQFMPARRVLVPTGRFGTIRHRPFPTFAVGIPQAQRKRVVVRWREGGCWVAGTAGPSPHVGRPGAVVCRLSRQECDGTSPRTRKVTPTSRNTTPGLVALPPTGTFELLGQGLENVSGAGLQWPFLDRSRFISDR
jgi:hypothetical protein